MDCDRTREELSAYLDGELEPGGKAALEEHLAGCESCREELESLRSTAGLVRSLPKVGAPEVLRRRIMSEVTRRPAKTRFPSVMALLTVAALLLVAVVAVFMLTKPGDDMVFAPVARRERFDEIPEHGVPGEDSVMKKKSNANGLIEAEVPTPSPQETELKGRHRKYAPGKPAAGGMDRRIEKTNENLAETMRQTRQLGREKWKDEFDEIERELRKNEAFGKQPLADAEEPGVLEELPPPGEPATPGKKVPGVEEYIVEATDVDVAVESIGEALAGMNLEIVEKPDELNRLAKRKRDEAEEVVLLVKVDSKEHEEVLRKLDSLKAEGFNRAGRSEEMAEGSSAPVPEEEEAKRRGRPVTGEDTFGKLSAQADEKKEQLKRPSAEKTGKIPELRDAGEREKQKTDKPAESKSEEVEKTRKKEAGQAESTEAMEKFVIRIIIREPLVKRADEPTLKPSEPEPARGK